MGGLGHHRSTRGIDRALEALEIGAHFRCRLAAHVAIFFQSFADDLFELGRKFRNQANRRRGLTIENRFRNHGGSFSAKGQDAGGHLVEHYAEGEKIGASVEFLAAQLFRRHVGNGADGGAGTSEVKSADIRESLRIAAGGAGGAGNFRQPEVENLGVAAIGNEDVRRLNIAMDDSPDVRGIESIGHFNREREQALELHGPAVDQMFQRLAAEALHHDEQMSIVLADFVDGADVGMIQRRSSPRLAAKAFEGLRILGRIVGKKFQGNEAAKLRVFRFVNDSHPSATEEFEDAVVRDCLADHGRSGSSGPRCLMRVESS